MCVCLSFVSYEREILNLRCNKYFLSPSPVQAEDPEGENGLHISKKAMVNLFSFTVVLHSAITVAAVTILSATV